MAIEINEDPNFDDIQKLLRDSAISDLVINLCTEDLTQKQIDLIYDHFKTYTACIKKLLKISGENKDQINTLNQALNFQSEQIKRIGEIVLQQQGKLKKLEDKKWFRFF